MLAEYPPDYAETCVQVQLQSPSVSKWPPADGFIFGQDINLLHETECHSALYYESFQDGSFDVDDDYDDDDEDLDSFFPPPSSTSLDSLVSSESSESEFEFPDQASSLEDECGSAGSDYLRNSFISILPELCLDEHMSLSTLLPVVDCPPPSSPPPNLTVGKEEEVSIDCAEEVIPSESPRGERKRKLKDVNWNEMSTLEKQSMVESLLLTMSSSLGPREKLEVSRILDTDGDISSVSYELSIDAENISEEKLARIQELVEESTENTSSCKKREFKQGRSNVENDIDNKSVNKKTKSQKKSQSADRSDHLRVSKERQRKECKQNIKEKRSGLFQQEEVMSLYRDGNSDEEIDILE